MVTSFKLLQLDGVMRKFTYDGPGRPSWNYVANKVSDLFGIPQNQVAVAYVDGDGDELTLSSNEELLDYYHHFLKESDRVRFIVKDLAASRGQSSKLSTDNTPKGPIPIVNAPKHGDSERAQQGNSMFGLHFEEEPTTATSGLGHSQTTEEDWDQLENLGIPTDRVLHFSMPNLGPGPRPFQNMGATDTTLFEALFAERNQTPRVVEVIDDDDEKDTVKPQPDDESIIEEIVIPHEDKGKGKAKETGKEKDIIDFSSNQSVTGSDTAHAYVNVKHPLDPTPKPVEDPPLPTTEPRPAEQTQASLFGDLSSLITALTSAVSSNPELSEGLRNLLRNASNGNYSHSAANIAQETTRNVLDSLNQLFSAVNLAGNQGPGGAPRDYPRGPGHRHRSPFPPIPPPPFGFGRPFGPHPHMHPFGGSPWSRHSALFPQNTGTRSHPFFRTSPPPPPPPPVGVHVHPPPPPPPVVFPPPPPALPGAYPFSGRPARMGPPPTESPYTPYAPDQPWYRPAQRGHTRNVSAATNASLSRLEMLRRLEEKKAELEEAKERYKEEKAQFRREREERRRARQQGINEQQQQQQPHIVIQQPSVPPTIIPSIPPMNEPMQDIDALLEASAPPRSVTHSPRLRSVRGASIAHRSPSIAQEVLDREDRDVYIGSPRAESSNSQDRLMKRLSDMGFTTTTHPYLARLVAQEATRFDPRGEDDTVAHLLDVLINADTAATNKVPGSWDM